MLCPKFGLQTAGLCLARETGSVVTTAVNVMVEGEADDDGVEECVVVNATAIIDPCIEAEWRTGECVDGDHVVNIIEETLSAGPLLQ